MSSARSAGQSTRPAKAGPRRPPLPALSPDALAVALSRWSPEELSWPAVVALAAHYEELRRWLPRLNLIGPGTLDEVIARHFGESLAALDLVPREGRMLDVGAGAGFPGLVLAAVRPRLEVTLLEPRQRKWAFLRQVSRRAGLSCTVLAARVGRELPSSVTTPLDLITVRALRLDSGMTAAFAEQLQPTGRILAWAGREEPELCDGLVVEEARPISGSEHRRILIIGRRAEVSSVP